MYKVVITSRSGVVVKDMLEAVDTSAACAKAEDLVSRGLYSEKGISYSEKVTVEAERCE